ncbi:MAG: hypothetical protein ACTIL5_09260 [Lactococcus cremoris]|uniref:Uncharacterized protein n=1 Tax=Lactococcus cremoris subsp. cremoris GE214 TaxID=1415168 RepID=A0A084A766_LACLC|nr:MULTISPECIES: hypothetical protein [Lactococcus]UXD81396.1 hypothetical protein D4044_029 [Lactococcus phage D4044]EHE94267.1 hypothetical protein LLCRE1631_00536 [Lactococcus lactis subsp. lactis CNCM I-1631]KEY61145.1 hypothetical protein U725_02709 [Lactococcus cremoris subsp. cremoris GE214]MDH8063321.1 hypothetical protein [Lactococcus lactis subsp. lactis]MDM7543941.1 hypothetical protein [Lactococcus lactis]
MNLFNENDDTRKSCEEKVFNYLRADFLRNNFGSPEEVQKNSESAKQLLKVEDKRLRTLVSGLSDQELLEHLKRADTHIPS